MLDSVNTYSPYNSDIPSFIRISDTTGRGRRYKSRQPVGQQRRKRLWDAERIRKLLLLVEEGLEYKEIASRLGMTVAALRNRLCRLRREREL